MLDIELLQPHHDRAKFDCGKESLNLFLQRNARQNADRNIGVTHVVVKGPRESTILGYFSLVTRTVEGRDFANKKLPHGPVGVVLLGRLAVDKSAQKQGLGKRMLLHAMKLTEQAADRIGIFALVLDAVDQEARSWYLGLGWGFEAMMDDPNHLFISVKTIRELGHSFN